MNCLDSFRTDNALKKHERLCDNNDYCNVEMPTQFNKTFKYNFSGYLFKLIPLDTHSYNTQFSENITTYCCRTDIFKHSFFPWTIIEWNKLDFQCRKATYNAFRKHFEKSLKTPFLIYADLECLLIKKQSCKNNPNESYTERKVIHEPCGYSLDLVYSFDSKQTKHSFYRAKDCIRKFCSDLKELGTKIVNHKQKEMIPLTDNENKYYEEQRECYICKKRVLLQ